MQPWGSNRPRSLLCRWYGGIYCSAAVAAAAAAVSRKDDQAAVPARTAVTDDSSDANEIRVLGLGTYAPVDVWNMLQRGEVIYDPVAKAYKATTAAQRTLTARRLTR